MVILASHPSAVPDMLVLFVLGCVIGFLAVPLASRRSLAQPVDQDHDAEGRFLAALLVAPAEILRVVPAISATDFVDPEYASLFERFSTVALEAFRDFLPPPIEPDEALNRHQIKARKAVIDLAVADLDKDPFGAPAAVLAQFADEVPSLPAPGDVSTPVLHYGQIVMSNGASRVFNTSRSPFVTTDNTLARQFVAPSRPRRLLTTLAAGAASAVGALLVHRVMVSSAAQLLGYLAILVVVFASVELSLVDFDTFYLDWPIFWPATVLAWIFAVLAQVLDHHPHRLLAGLATAVFIGVVFESLSRIYARMRGRTQGAGDTLIIILTIGVPAALAGSWFLGLYSLIVGCAAAISEWIYRHVRFGATATTPVAFGPHLALGWPITAVVLMALHTL